MICGMERCQGVGGIAFLCFGQGCKDLAVFSLCFGYVVLYARQSPLQSGEGFHGRQWVSALSEGLMVNRTECPCNMLGMVRRLSGLFFIIFLTLLANFGGIVL